MVSEWMDIESAPKDGSDIILYGKDEYGEFYEVNEKVVQIGFWDRNSWRLTLWGPYESKLWFLPTHWMPLPTPPKEPK